MAAPGRIAELRIGARPEPWAAAGFAVEGDAIRLGSTRIRLLADASAGGVAGWSLAGVDGADFDGIETAVDEDERGAGGAPAAAPAAAHPNGALTIDHVVVFSPALGRTIARFEGSGVRCRRVREPGDGPGPPMRQAFFRLGETIVEVVEVPEERAGPGGRARLWGLTAALADIDAAVAELGELVGTVREAVQPGRRIVTFRREAGLGLPVALITPAD